MVFLRKLNCAKVQALTRIYFKPFDPRSIVYETIALVGATGAVGRIVLEQLEKREFPYKRLKLLASERSVGREVRVGGEIITVELLEPGAVQRC